MDIEKYEWLSDLEKSVKDNKSKYDIIVPISGGKDGAFMLWLIKKHSNLRVLAYHIDNGFVSDMAENNMKKMCDELECDCEIIRPNWLALKEIYRKLLLQNGEICIACEMMISLYPIETAIKLQIPYIVWGLTPNQINSKKICSGYKKIDYNYYRNIVDYYEKIIGACFSDDFKSEMIKRQLLINNSITKEDYFPTFVMPFYWTGYDAAEVESIVTNNIDWVRPTDAGGTSSNCVINQLHIYLKKQIKGEEFYKKMIDKKYDNGEVTDEVMKYALDNSEDSNTIKESLGKLDIDMDLNTLAEHVKNAKKSIYLKMESNISQ